MLEVEPNGQRGRTVTGSGRNGNDAFTGAASEAFGRWLHHRYAHRTVIGGAYRFAARFLISTTTSEIYGRSRVQW